MMKLTPRQLQVLTLVADGLTQTAAAKSLGIAYGTLEVHLQNAYTNLGAVNAPHAIYIAMKAGLIQ
jgi:DNA-binding NarL/FixJ family response regulator